MRRNLTRIFLAIWLLLAAAAPARADPVSLVILGVLSIEATATAVAVTTFSLTFLATAFGSIGLSYLAKALAPKPPQSVASVPGGTTGELQTGGVVSRSFVVGRNLAEISLAYPATYGAEAALTAAAALGQTTAAAGNTPNAYFVQVIAYSDLPVTGLAQIIVDGAPVTWNPEATPSFEGIAIPEKNKDGKDHLWIRNYDGTQTAADPAMVALFAGDPDWPYGSDRIGTGIAYAIVTALTDPELFSGFPAIKLVPDGVKLYDRRFDSTVGGSGTQRRTDPSTWTFMCNAAVIAENILRGITFNGQHCYGFQTVCEPQLPFAAWITAENECDVAIALLAGGSEPQFAAGGVIRYSTPPADTLEELLKAGNGRLAEIGGVYKPLFGAPGAAVLSFTDANILSTDKRSFEPFPTIDQTVNAVTAKWLNPAMGWSDDDAALYSADLEAADGGRRQAVDVVYGFVNSGTQVQRLMQSERDTHRAFRKHILPMPPATNVLEPLDVCSWDSAANGYFAKPFIVEIADDLPNCNMGIAFKEIDGGAYNWTPETDEKPVSSGTISILRPPPQAIIDWRVDPWTVISDSGQSLAAIKLSWDPNTDDIIGVDYQVRLKSSGELVLADRVTDRVKLGAITLSENLIFNTVYQVRIRYVPGSARDTIWTEWRDVLTPDVRIEIAAFVEALQKRVTSEIDGALADIRDAQNLTAAVAAEADQSHWIDKQTTRLILAQSVSGLSKAIVQQVSNAATGASEALATYELSADAQFNDVDSSIFQLDLARSTGDRALAESISSVSTTLSGHTAQLTELLSSVDGNEVRGGLIGTIDGVSGGLVLHGFIVNGAVHYDLAIDANTFVGQLTAGHLAAGSVDSPEVIADRIIVAGHLAAGSVDSAEVITDRIILAGHLLTNGIENTADFFLTAGTYSNDSGPDHVGGGSHATIGGRAKVIINLHLIVGAGHTGAALIIVKVDGVATANPFVIDTFAGTTGFTDGGFAGHLSLTKIVTGLSDDDHTFDVYISNQGSGDAFIVAAGGLVTVENLMM